MRVEHIQTQKQPILFFQKRDRKTYLNHPHKYKTKDNVNNPTPKEN